MIIMITYNSTVLQVYKNCTQNHMDEHCKEHCRRWMHHEADDLVQYQLHLHKPLSVLHLENYLPQLSDSKCRVSNQNWPIVYCL